MRYSPAQSGQQIIHECVKFGSEFLRLARLGTHEQNPYHNLTHELQTVHWAYACAANSGNRVDPNLLIAALFHDHNHSGGKESDSRNVDEAIRFVNESKAFRTLLPSNYGDEDGRRIVAQIAKMISITEFDAKNKQFVHSPITDQFARFEMQCLRDADLMPIYSEEGRHLLFGLYKEMGLATYEREDALKVWEGQAKFLREAEMFTDYGKRMKAHHLEACLADLYTQLVGPDE